LSRNFLPKIKSKIAQVLAEGSSASSVALGFSIGLFIGLLPIMGLQTLPAIALSVKFRANKITALIGVWITNPLTVVPIYYFNYRTGCMLLPKANVVVRSDFVSLLHDFSFSTAMAMGSEISMALLVGSLVNAIIVSVPAYFIIRYVYAKWHIVVRQRLYR
jgi:uncharacterized protein (DUF2062 family)